ncbi:DUF2332 family protein [Siculibacillus lacustris]|uniref:DUF2332 family protein n=1 Tax=Siculibacillus lacustris TaxID=1549641 RepID=A0A4Q9VWN5_9HYPH|nr:DUF2332 family protein [Siculibacillus lacustris]TBW40742.1 DUF2332 family protein [Siculibacillus lacustris]
MTESAAIVEALHNQARMCRDLGSPFTARLCDILARDLDRTTAFGRRILTWTGDPRRDALALRACGALNALAHSGDAAELAAVWPPERVDDHRLAGVIADILPRFDLRLTEGLASPPQTNEVGRSAVLLGGALVVAAETGLPLELFEIGASAGLNLLFDRHRYDLGVGTWGPAASAVRIACDWRGTPPPLDAPLAVIARAGCDLMPIDPGDPHDRRRLLAYIWADQTERLERTRAALEAAAAAGLRVERAEAGDWTEDHLAAPPRSGRVRVVMHSVAWQYMAEATRARITDRLAAAGAAATAAAPLAWLRMEGDAVAPESAAVLLTLWPGGETRALGRADFHGRWVAWTIGHLRNVRESP